MSGPSALVVAAVSALTASLVAVGPAPAAPPPGVECSWRITASHVLAELDGDTSERAEDLRQALLDVGAGEPGFVPAGCYDSPGDTGETGGSGSGSGSGSDDTGSGGTGSGDTGSDDTGSDDTGSGGSGDSGNTGDSGSGNSGSGDTVSGTTGSGNTGSGNTGDSAGSTDPAAPAGGSGPDGQCTTTAASRYGWGAPAQEDQFEGTAVSDGWTMYDGPGHGGNGRRTPDAISVADGQLTITGSENGDAGGMAWTGSQQFGRWEGCVRSPAPAASSLHTLLLLWPSAENWPVGGEVDFMEISDGARQKVEGFLHYGEDNSQTHGSVEVDASQWHAFAVEWTPEQITYLVDGEPWFTDSDPSHNPPGPMHLTIQLDYFGGDASGGAEMNVDWVRQWPMEGAGLDVDIDAGGVGVELGVGTGGGTSSTGSDRGSGEDARRGAEDGAGDEDSGDDGSRDGDSGGGDSGDGSRSRSSGNDSDDESGGGGRAGS
ncbi:family 16 glycosylhydrolase [Pseudonocardia sp. ICBG1293]|uniref:glycoside hydrolase family 16 protein n=1 Tax=Pseudonocardia sp. ICBG1293 TaxID=2844382 RepID=UPI001CCFBA60|nr:glycoside hydrolase family 16 protein [Pseudonocardia sp. ICBG1293]